MYFAVVKITFEFDPEAPAPDRKDLHNMVEKIRSRFRVTVMPCNTVEEDGVTAIAYTSLAHSEESLNKQMDAIATFCEEAGFCRIADEAVLMDHIEIIGRTGEDA